MPARQRAHARLQGGREAGEAPLRESGARRRTRVAGRNIVSKRHGRHPDAATDVAGVRNGLVEAAALTAEASGAGDAALEAFT
jgi:hypothetical protein